MPSLVPEHDQWAFHPKPPLVNWEPDLEALQESITIGQSRIDALAKLIRGLTYGQMITLSAELGSHGPITKDTIANVLWVWSVANAVANAGRAEGIYDIGEGSLPSTQSLPR